MASTSQDWTNKILKPEKYIIKKTVQNLFTDNMETLYKCNSDIWTKGKHFIQMVQQFRYFFVHTNTQKAETPCYYCCSNSDIYCAHVEWSMSHFMQTPISIWLVRPKRSILNKSNILDCSDFTLYITLVYQNCVLLRLTHSNFSWFLMHPSTVLLSNLTYLKFSAALPKLVIWIFRLLIWVSTTHIWMEENRKMPL